MTKTAKILLLVVSILAIVLVGCFVFYFKNNKTIITDPVPVTAPVENLKNFTASNGSFSFDYNSVFSIISGTDVPTMDWELNSKQNGLVLASVFVPRSYMSQTNFSDAKLTIGKSADVNAIKNCLADTFGLNIKGVPATVSGYLFTKFAFSDAGAGNFYETTSYKGIVGGDCYAVEYTIHYTNIGNYSPDQGIKEFDKTKITNDLESIVRSFRLIVASN